MLLKTDCGFEIEIVLGTFVNVAKFSRPIKKSDYCVDKDWNKLTANQTQVLTSFVNVVETKFREELLPVLQGK